MQRDNSCAGIEPANLQSPARRSNQQLVVNYYNESKKRKFDRTLKIYETTTLDVEKDKQITLSFKNLGRYHLESQNYDEEGKTLIKRFLFVQMQPLIKQRIKTCKITTKQ